MVEISKKELEQLRNSLEFHKKRTELLTEKQHLMRDPERNLVCHILTNGQLLSDPKGKLYGPVNDSSEVKELKKHLKAANKGAERNMKALNLNIQRYFKVKEERDILAKLVYSVNVTGSGEIVLYDVDGKYWFDVRDSILNDPLTNKNDKLK